MLESAIDVSFSAPSVSDSGPYRVPSYEKSSDHIDFAFAARADYTDSLHTSVATSQTFRVQAIGREIQLVVRTAASGEMLASNKVFVLDL